MENFVSSSTGIGLLSFLGSFGLLFGAFAIGKPKLIRHKYSTELDWGKAAGFAALFALLVASSVYLSTCGVPLKSPEMKSGLAFAVSFGVIAGVLSWAKPQIALKKDSDDIDFPKVAGYSALFSILVAGMVFLTACREAKLRSS